MRKRHVVSAIAFALAMALSIPAGAADLHEAHVGTACPEGQTGTWHFVNVQTDGAAAGTLEYSLDGGAVAGSVGAYKVNPNMQHFLVVGGNTLDSASTNLPGKLVLSDYTCEGGKKGGGGGDGGKK